MSDEFDAVVERVRERVEPDAAERERLDAVADDLRERARAAIADLPVDADVIQVGSTARDTWLAGDRDVDLFVAFPPDLDRERLESYGLDVGHAVLPEGHEEYAEHPYVKGVYDDFDVDLVPCYAVEDATEIQSAVDRTPFHTEYLTERIDADLAGEVRVAKQFLTGIGVYGSDLRTRGFSGYLTELLVHEYGDFRAFVEGAADWHPPVTFDPEDHAEERETASPSRNDEVGGADLAFDDPLVVVDPTDPERNVAAVCTAESVARLQHYARDLLADPRESLFFAALPEAVDAETVRETFERRGTTPVALRFAAPDIVEDQLYPQLDRSLAGIVGELDRRGFDVLRAAAWADETVALLAELEVAERPTVERHEGPPVHVRGHSEGFYEAYADDDPESDGTYGPFLDGDRYVVERPRAFETAVGLLESDALFDVALGAQIEAALEGDYEVLAGEAVSELAEEFGVELARYLAPRP
ncbi:CCA tRNA nucleotidyltransferase [Halosimplex salinum]|uniref:CCA tRNA nucleotidyltransferase n=1 Tax=Halosimplex salinum TaxID=1710538 RepID=UPI000F486721|nr:CCA tRNA nucleotidyltransferase [Halosimplex salinum]